MRTAAATRRRGSLDVPSRTTSTARPFLPQQTTRPSNFLPVRLRMLLSQSTQQLQTTDIILESVAGSSFRRVDSQYKRSIDAVAYPPVMSMISVAVAPFSVDVGG